VTVTASAVLVVVVLAVVATARVGAAVGIMTADVLAGLVDLCCEAVESGRIVERRAVAKPLPRWLSRPSVAFLGPLACD
jgi:hypothetical protein